ACARILRREHTHLGVPSHFSIYDEGDTERVITLCLKQMNVDPKRYPPRQVAAVIGRAKDNLIAPAEFAEEATTYYERTVADVYSWRGATIKNLLDFEHDYPEAAVFVMEQNYRSTQSILELANALIEHNIQRKPKSLWTDSDRGELAIRYRAENEHDEAWFVA